MRLRICRATVEPMRRLITSRRVSRSMFFFLSMVSPRSSTDFQKQNLALTSCSFSLMARKSR